MFYFDIFKVPLPNLRDTYEKHDKTVKHKIRGSVSIMLKRNIFIQDNFSLLCAFGLSLCLID